MAEVIVLYDGYSQMCGKDQMVSNCSCTLIIGTDNIIVDTMTPWDADILLYSLGKYNMKPEDITYVVSTHGHSDHTGNNNLFKNAKHFVGFSISFQDRYFLYPFEKGEEYVINDQVKIIPTPGHTLSDITLLVTSYDGQIIAITGDLFERAEDIENPGIWMDAGSEDIILQRRNRSKIANLADWIVPGHGCKFEVTERMRETLNEQASLDALDETNP